MRRRGFVAATALALSAACTGLFMSSAAAQHQKVQHIGVLAAGNPRSAPNWVAFEARLRELGHVEGRTLEIEFRDGAGRSERIAAAAAELAGLGPDLIVAAGPEAVLRAVQGATNTIPIVMVAIDFDPVARGYVASLGRPGGNITGLNFRQVELAAKRLELLKEALPGVARVAVLWDVFSGDQLGSAQAAARDLGLELQSSELRNAPYDIEGACLRQPPGTGPARC